MNKTIDGCYLTTGCLVRVRYGNVGFQTAIVTRGPRWDGDVLMARKFQANSGRWTKPMRVNQREVLVGLPASALTPDMRAKLGATS